MAGRITKSEDQLRPDSRFNDLKLSKFINCIMTDGRKTSATRVVYDALDLIDEKLKKELFHEKQHEWIFRNNPCTICMSLYHTLLSLKRLFSWDWRS